MAGKKPNPAQKEAQKQRKEDLKARLARNDRRYLEDFKENRLQLNNKQALIKIFTICKEEPQGFKAVTNCAQVDALVARVDEVVEWLERDDSEIILVGHWDGTHDLSQYKLHAIVIEIFGTEPADVCFKFKLDKGDGVIAKVANPPFATCKQLAGFLETNPCNKCAIGGKIQDCGVGAANRKQKKPKNQVQEGEGGKGKAKEVDHTDYGIAHITKHGEPEERLDLTQDGIEQLNDNYLDYIGSFKDGKDINRNDDRILERHLGKHIAGIEAHLAAAKRLKKRRWPQDDDVEVKKGRKTAP